MGHFVCGGQSHPEVSFSAKIEALEKANTKLDAELVEWKELAMVESESKRKFEEEVAKLKDTIQHLEEEVAHLATDEKRFMDRIFRYDQGLSTIGSLLEKLKGEKALFPESTTTQVLELRG